MAGLTFTIQEYAMVRIRINGAGSGFVEIDGRDMSPIVSGFNLISEVGLPAILTVQLAASDKYELSLIDEQVGFDVSLPSRRLLEAMDRYYALPAGDPAEDDARTEMEAAQAAMRELFPVLTVGEEVG